MTANSTYWKAKLRFYDLEYREWGKTPALNMPPIQCQVGNDDGNTIGSCIYPFSSFYPGNRRTKSWIIVECFFKTYFCFIIVLHVL